MPACARFLAEPHRYKAMWGGRAGVKSWSMARQLVIEGARRPLRWLFARETMRSIKESVHLLLCDQIKMLGLSQYYEIQQNQILGKHRANQGTLFVYAGLRSLVNDATSLKAFESFDGVWVEEAQGMSQQSLRTLIPTLRKPGSEIWFSFNPSLESDPIIEFLFKTPPPGLAIVKTSYRDNPWLSEEARKDMEHLRRTNPKEFAHVYEGEFLTEVEGAIFAAELGKMVEEGRETRVPYDPSRPVETYWDIGDHWTAIWFVQVYPLEYHLIDYRIFEVPGLDQIFADLHKQPYNYSVHKMTQDAKAPQLATGKTIEQQAMALAGGARIHVLPVMTFKAQLAQAKRLFPLCWFDKDKCVDGLNALRHYRFPEPGRTGVERDKPLHDWASHGGSAFLTFAVGVQGQGFAPKPKPAPQPFIRSTDSYSWMGM